MQAEQTRAADARYRGMMDYYTAWVHQIKTPIAAMRLQNHDTPEARALLLDLGRIERYVEMVMTYLRLDSASTDYCFRRCDLDALMRGVVRGFAGEFIDRRPELGYEPVPLTVLTDEKWLAFVLGQVLSNALKYTPSGRISVFLCAPRTLCIRDTGIGIAPQALPRVFENGFTGFNGRVDRRASGIACICAGACASAWDTRSPLPPPSAKARACVSPFRSGKCDKTVRFSAGTVSRFDGTDRLFFV